MDKHGLIAGAGIAGLACGVALARAGWTAQLFEQAPQFGEVGAGVQLGPNVTRILQRWEVFDAIKAQACTPDVLQARCAQGGQVLARLPLGASMQEKYGAPYLTIHRADLHHALMQKARELKVGVHCAMHVDNIHTHPDGLQIQLEIADEKRTQYAAMAVVADGVWSQLRPRLLNDSPTEFTGHLAYRALMRQSDLPAHLRTQEVTVWMGPDAHVVHYPVKAGEWLNIVCLVHSRQPESSSNGHPTWEGQKSSEQTLADLQAALRGACPALRDLLLACEAWTLWPLYARALMNGAQQHAQGRIAVVGDAAHPMLPYLAQGAGMAIEDAAQLEEVLQSASASHVDDALQQFAQMRWRRNARVQARALRNGRIFHADGWTRVGRDLGLRLLGEQLMDVPWLYGHGMRHS
jgi:salicylate hydroxylase